MSLADRVAELEVFAAYLRIKLTASHAREKALQEELNEIRAKLRDATQGELQ